MHQPMCPVSPSASDGQVGASEGATVMALHWRGGPAVQMWWQKAAEEPEEPVSPTRRQNL